jgi:hypothetical protein
MKYLLIFTICLIGWVTTYFNNRTNIDINQFKIKVDLIENSNCFDSVNNIIKIDSGVSLIQQRDSLIFFYSQTLNDTACNEWKIKFFYFFPSTFNNFLQLYSAEDRGLLHRIAHKHIRLLRSITCINKTMYYEKLIKIGLNGFWESDGVGDLQVLIRKKINEDTHLSFKLLSELSQDEVYSFFKFIFDGPVLLEIEPKWEITGEQFPDILFQMIKAHKDLSKITR